MIKPKHQVRSCYFCDTKTVPDYKDIQVLEKFTTERGKLVGRSRSGCCNRHQNQLTRSIKRARFLAMLPYVVRV